LSKLASNSHWNLYIGLEQDWHIADNCIYVGINTWPNGYVK
jgi:hypothetical protein